MNPLQENDYVRIVGDLQNPAFRNKIGVLIEEREWYPGWLVKILEGNYQEQYVLVKEKNLVFESRERVPNLRWNRKLAAIPQYTPHQRGRERVETRIVFRQGMTPSEVTYPTSASFGMLNLDGVDVSADEYFNSMIEDGSKTQLLNELGIEIITNGNTRSFATSSAAQASRGFVRQSMAAKEKGSLMLAIEKISAAILMWKGFPPVQLYANRSELSRLMSQVDSEETDHWKFQALRDADEVIHRQPGWSRGHSRRGNALAALGRNLRAVSAYDQALEIEPNNPVVAAARQATKQKLS
jgi:tetratricopeptide (TPR) repeat protein